MTLRHIYFLQCSSFGEVDFIDLETRFCFPFLMGALVNEVDFGDLEAFLLPLVGVLL